MASHLRASDLKKGSVVTCVQTYVVTSTGAGRTTLHTVQLDNPRREFSTLDNEVLSSEFYGVDGVGEAREMTATQLSELLHTVGSLPVKVVFHKKKTQKDVTDALESMFDEPDEYILAGGAGADRKRRRTRLSRAARSLLTGEERTMTGTVAGFDDSGRAILHEVKVGEDGTFETVQERRVDTRTLQSLTFGGQRYVLKNSEEAKRARRGA